MIIPQALIDAKNAAQWGILALPGVVGVGIGMREDNGQLFDDELAIRVLVADASQVPPGIPNQIGGVDICIIEAQIKPCVLQPQPCQFLPDLARYDPLAGGVRITAPTRGSGTLGSIVQDATTGELLGLSCFHVVGDGSLAFPNTIWQPNNPPLVHGSPPAPDDNIGRVIRSEFPQTQPLPFSPVLASTIEAAVFPLTPALNQGRNLSPAIVGQDAPATLVDRITATVQPDWGQEVRKRGSQTRVTEGIVIDPFLTTQWTAGPSNAYLIDQFMIAGSTSSQCAVFCKEGDSGSIILKRDSPTAIGVLWAGSHGGTRAYAMAIRNVESQLGVNVVWQ